MAITHVRFVHSKIPPDWAIRTFENLEDGKHVLLLDLVTEGTNTSVGRLYRELDPSLKVTDCVVLRGRWPDIQVAVSRDPVFREEVGDRPVVGLVGGGRAECPGPEIIPLRPFRPLDQPLDISALRQAELESLLVRTGAIFEHDSSHYRLPSKYHAEKFIRLADALRSLSSSKNRASRGYNASSYSTSLSV